MRGCSPRGMRMEAPDIVLSRSRRTSVGRGAATRRAPHTRPRVRWARVVASQGNTLQSTTTTRDKKPTWRAVVYDLLVEDLARLDLRCMTAHGHLGVLREASRPLRTTAAFSNVDLSLPTLDWGCNTAKPASISKQPRVDRGHAAKCRLAERRACTPGDSDEQVDAPR